MRYLALDIGTKRCGVAISDKTNILSCPYKTLEYKFEDYNSLASLINEIIMNEKITHLAIGRPINMDGSLGFASKRSEELLKYIDTENISVHYIDERLSTVEAMSILHQNGKNTKNTKKIIDTVSACVILESFMKRISNGVK